VHVSVLYADDLVIYRQKMKALEMNRLFYFFPFHFYGHVDVYC
jgi:hypothetical protein